MADINSSYGSFTSKVNNVNMLKYLIKRPTVCKENDSQYFSKQLLATSKDLYKKNLIAHYGCVNAIEFSSDGNLLFSGGDDRRVLMWNVNNAMMYYSGKLDVCFKPKVMRACHYSNIFCLAVDDKNKRVLSGSNDDQVIVHDYTTGNPVDYFVHDTPVFSLSLHPVNGNIFASAADNGKISVYDIRESNSDPLCLAKLRTPFHGVMFNPSEPFLIASANSKLGIHIWDLRKPKEVVHECSDEQSMAVRWNSSGSNLLALRNLLPPILYNPRYPKRKIEFDADGYFNACTMKSCSFAGNNDEYVLAGSDDFNLYMWKIPDPWPENKWITKAHLSLTGHRSIVNQVRYDPNKQLIASSGVEKVIKIWSPLRMPYSEGNRDKPSQKRSRVLCSSKACSRSPGFLSHDYSQESVDEDTKMIHFFDSLLRNELHGSTTAAFTRFYCVDGKLFPIIRKRKETKTYEKLIVRKKKHLSKILNVNNDGDPPICSLSQVSNGNENQSKKYHFSIEENQLLTASEDESNLGDAAQSDERPASSSASSNNTKSSPSSSSSSSSSSSTSSASTTPLSSSLSSSSSQLDLILNSSYCNETHVSSESDLHSQRSNSDSPFPLKRPMSKYYFSNSESEDSEDGGEKDGSLKNSGVNVSGSSDSDNVKASSSFKRKRFNAKNRCYRNSRPRRSSLSSIKSSDVETCSKNATDEPEVATKTLDNSNSECANGVTDQTNLNFGNNSSVISEVKNSVRDESNLDDYKKS